MLLRLAIPQLLAHQLEKHPLAQQHLLKKQVLYRLYKQLEAGSWTPQPTGHPPILLQVAQPVVEEFQLDLTRHQNQQ